MYEEQRMIAGGVPFSEASRREIAMGRFDGKEYPVNHTCKCSGQGNCPDCPNKNK